MKIETGDKDRDLMIAISHNKGKKIRTLIAEGADVNATFGGASLLTWAFTLNSVYTHDLLGAGAKIEDINWTLLMGLRAYADRISLDQLFSYSLDQKSSKNN